MLPSIWIECPVASSYGFRHDSLDLAEDVLSEVDVEMGAVVV